MKFLGSCLSINRIQKSITIYRIKCFRYVQRRNSDSRSMSYIMLNDCFQHKQCTLKHIRTSKLAKFFRVVSTCPDSTRREGERGKGRGREKERRGKGKGRRHDGKKGGGRKAW